MMDFKLSKIDDNHYDIIDEYEDEEIIGKIEIKRKVAYVRLYEHGDYEIYATGMIKHTKYVYHYKSIRGNMAIETEKRTNYIYEDIMAFHDSPDELDCLYREILNIIE